MPNGTTQQDTSAAGTPAAGATGEPGQRQQPGFVGSATGQPIVKPPEGAAAGADPGQQQLPLAGGDGSTGAPPPPPEGAGAPPPAGERSVVGHGGDMSPEAISERVGRERKKWLKEEYGTDDEREIARVKQERVDASAARENETAELKKYRDDAEAKRRSDMTELERAKADLVAKEKELDEAREELNGIRTDTLAEKQDAIVGRVLSGQIDERYLDLARPKLARHFRELTKDEQTGFDERKLERWARTFVKDYPETARKADPPAVVGDPAAPPAKPAPRRAPVRTSKVEPGSASPKPAPAAGPGVLAGKTVKPGQTNSMTKSELNEFYQQQTGRKKPY